MAALLVAAPPAVAQTTADKAAAEALFQAGRDLMTAGKYKDACEKFEGSQKLDAGLGTLLFLADCYEKADRIASAWATFREAESIASGRGDQSRAQVAKGRYTALEPRLSKLWIKVADGNDATIQVKRDGQPIPRESWGVALPTDSGEHLLEASAPGKKPWSKKVTVTGEGANVSVEVPLLEPEPAAVPAAAVAAPKAAVTNPTPEAEPAPSHTLRTVSYILGGAGILGLGFGTFYTVRANSKKNESNKHCDPNDTNQCNEDGVALRNQALSSAHLATAFVIGGSVLLAGGIVLFIVAPSGSSAKTGARSTLRLAAGPTRAGGQVSVGGTF
jgi:tetratricopeptide (TPR) repeat protein